MRSTAPSGTSGSPRTGSGGRSATTVPLRSRVTSTPRWRRSLMADATVAGLRASSSAIARTDGRRVPGPSRPASTARSTAPATSLAVRPVIA